MKSKNFQVILYLYLDNSNAFITQFLSYCPLIKRSKFKSQILNLDFSTFMVQEMISSELESNISLSQWSRNWHWIPRRGLFKLKRRSFGDGGKTRMRLCKIWLHSWYLRAGWNSLVEVGLCMMKLLFITLH